jgi:DNA-binding MarR family transcriptional regulator
MTNVSTSRFRCRTLRRMARTDRVDRLVAQWRDERPDLDVDVMAEVARLLLVGEALARRIDGLAAAHGLDRGQGDVLFTLRRSGPPYRLSPSDLTAALLVTSGTMTNRLDRLEAAGLIERRANPSDRRGVDVQLTPRGTRLADELVTTHVAHEARWLAPLTAGDRRQLVRITRKLLAHLSSERAG